MKKIKILGLFLISIILFISCDNNKFRKTQNNTKENNVYKRDKKLREICNFHQQGNIDELSQILQTNNSIYVQRSILSLAAICDSNTAPLITVYFKNDDYKIRENAAFSMGNFGAFYFEGKLFNVYKNETNKYVKKQILISLGKTGKSKALNFVASLSPHQNEDIIMQGQGKSFYYFAQNGFISEQVIAKTIEMINNPKISQTSKLAYSYVLTTDASFDLTNNYSIIENEIKISTNIYLQTNLTIALKHVRSKKSIDLLHSLLNSDADYRVKVAALTALKTFKYNSVKKVFFEMLLNENSNISIMASQFFVDNGRKSDAAQYFNYSKKNTSWQARSNLLTASLKYSNDKNKIAQSIISGYKVSENKYEKAALLYSLSADPKQYKFVKEQTFNSTEKVISSAGIKSLYEMRLNSNFNVIAKKMKYQKNVDMYAEFKLIFKEAISEGDNAMIYYATKAINDSSLNIIDILTNTYFISQAMSSVILPRDIKIYHQLCESLRIYGGTKCKDNVEIKHLEIDWDILSSIPSEQIVIVETNKGDFEITLDINLAPATVYIFLKLVESDYYNNTFFYKNNIGKAIINGGKRGDGWMNINIPLIKEISPTDFKDGTVAMLLNSENYQSINWFISTFPEINFEGKYTVFGNVTKGLEIVHNLEKGDVIIEIKKK
ncbi:MAG: peptidylprolyl isomerase [Bacteroidota bacterium]|nr:peptidylprolyl isomerase [Bacteroidota bacterium]